MSSPRRILMVGKGWFPEHTGGLDRYFRELFLHMPEAQAVVVGGQQAVAADMAARGRTIGTVSRHDAWLPLRLWAMYRAIRSLAREVDVVDVHFALYAFLPVLVRAVRPASLIVHFQGPWADENVAAGDSSRIRVALRRALERYVYRRATRIVTLTEAFRDILVHRYGVDADRVSVLAPGVDLVRFTPAGQQPARIALGIPNDAFVVCCVRRLVPRMGLATLLEAWRAVSAAPRPMTLMIAGDGPLRESLESYVRDQSLVDSVVLMGRIDDEKLTLLYQASDVNIVPSHSFEGYGLVLLEAAACGTPSIGTRVGGIPEVLSALDPSLIVEPRSAEAISTRVLAAADGRLPTRAAARSWAKSHDWQSVADRHRALVGRAHGARDRLRVLRVADVSGTHPGGMAGYMRFSGAALTDRGHTVSYWFSDDLGSAALPPGLRRLMIPWLIAARVVASRQSWDVVEIHEPLAYVYALLARRLPGLPACVVLSHGLEERGWAAQRARWRIQGHSARLRSRLSVPLTRVAPSRVALRNAGAIVVVSTADRNHLARARRPQAVWVAPGGADAEFFSITPLAQETVGLIFVGTWIDRKGASELTRAWSIVAKKHAAIHLTLAGTGVPPELVHADFESHGSERVRVLQHVDRAALAKLLAIHQIFVLPSWFEGLPLSLVEAGAAGLACVVSNVCGNADFACGGADSETGSARLIPPHDPQALADAIDELLIDPDRRRRLAEHARLRAQDFTWPATANQLELAYRGALSNHDLLSRS